MRNEKGEDWGKFMGELNKIGPYLPSMGADANGGSSIPILNRQHARQLGFQNMGEARQSILDMDEKLKAIEAHKRHILGSWFDKEMQAILPVWLIKLAGKRPWILKALGFRLNWGDSTYVDDGKTYPCTVTTIDWLFWMVAGNRHVWQH